MDFLYEDIGSAKDNFSSPIHNWYKFTAGFSYKFVDEIIKKERLEHLSNAKVFDPFAGCGTTLVSCQKKGIQAVGNEGQSFMYDVIRAKLAWRIDERVFYQTLNQILNRSEASVPQVQPSSIHPLIKSLYCDLDPERLYALKDAINEISGYKYKLFFRLALSQTLHKVAKHPIAVPYISRSRVIKNRLGVFECFSDVCKRMFKDLASYHECKRTSKIYLHDSRLFNPNIEGQECTTCITSPPYLNNLDYGEVSKVHTHFFDITIDWNDITDKVRKKLVTGSTTHYYEKDFELDSFKETEFYLENKRLVRNLLKITSQIKEISKGRAGKKSFDILTLLYFKDMYEVLKEIRRIVHKRGSTYLILGDSAPYGVHIETTKIMGELAKPLGFDKSSIHKIRVRGTKWKSLTHRHSLELSENLLILE